MSETVFVTGASGRIGRRLIPLLTAKGYRVRALIHSRRLDIPAAGTVEEVAGSILDQESLIAAASGCELVVHLAAAWDMFPPAVHERENNQLFESVVRGTYNVLEACRADSVLKAFAYASTDAVYATGMRSFSRPIDETTELVPSRFYAGAKIVCEALCAQYRALYALPTIVLRICWCLEPAELIRLFTFEFWEASLSAEDRERLAPRLADGRGLFLPTNADGSPAVDHVSHPQDIAAGIVAALQAHERAEGGTYNLAGPAPFRYVDVVPALAEQLGLPWDTAAVAGIEPYELLIEHARSVFGYSPVYPVEESVREALQDRSKLPFVT